ncbi:MAG: potassium-transporting ATPase subunit F [Synechococcales cyanobacterium RU_4_20]|nr:potassium-transporting ATPase subunit F [Synechococcales cyanobacterium RU_4_20]NJR70845.1 potassium-transporting ATPase subunit F [Synechococcales cyanobacterium CRU_2_2]
MQELSTRFCQKRLPKLLLLSLLMAAAIAPRVQATTGLSLERGQSLAIVLLGITTLALSVYLFVVIFQPERF